MVSLPDRLTAEICTFFKVDMAEFGPKIQAFAKERVAAAEQIEALGKPGYLIVPNAFIVRPKEIRSLSWC